MKLSPQMYQSIQLMALPVQDLKLKIQEEVEKNPALEIVEQNSSNISLDDVQKKGQDEYEYFENTSDPGVSSPSDSDSKRLFIEGTLSRPESLQEYLLRQLHVQPVRDEIFRLGELLIQNLDENGFNIEEPEMLAKEFSSQDLAEAVTLVRMLDPPGTCTSNYKHSLLVQALQLPEMPKYTDIVIHDYFEYLEKGKIKEIAKKIRISDNDVTSILNFIKKLNPFPGRQFSTDTSLYVIPDLMIKVIKGEIVIVLNDEVIPVLEICPSFEEIREELEEKDKNVKKYINLKIKEARWFIQTLALRNQTLLKTAAAIADFQQEFFYKGPGNLAPLTLKNIAEKVSVHETTISRISNSKYVQTDWGIFELKYFFSTALSRTDSSEKMVLREKVKHMIKEIIETEGKDRHLSDQNITDFLKEKKEIKIARRTVAKYRKELDIASSYER